MEALLTAIAATKDPMSGRFVKGQSGNPRGRPRGSGSHATELRRLEEDAIELAVNTAAVIAETVRLVLMR
jgi:hypothetical protein